jgi:hypothetical protein
VLKLRVGSSQELASLAPGLPLKVQENLLLIFVKKDIVPTWDWVNRVPALDNGYGCLKPHRI